MKNSIALLILLLFLFTGCRHNRTEERTVQDSLYKTISRLPAGEPVIYPDNRDIIHVDMKEGRAEIRFFKKEDQTIYLEFDPGKYTRLHAELSAEDSLANIRFNQLFMPGKAPDGPFGRHLDHELEAGAGIYHLSVHENMMEGDPWSGIVIVELVLSE